MQEKNIGFRANVPKEIEWHGFMTLIHQAVEDTHFAQFSEGGTPNSARAALPRVFMP